MKVTDHWSIRGRGECVGIDALPEELVEGMYVRRVASGLRGGLIEPRWRVIGIETYAMPRSHTNGQPAGLLLIGPSPLPVDGSEIEVVREIVTERRTFEGELQHEDEMRSLDAYVVLSREPPEIAYWQRWVDGLYGKRVRITVEVLEEVP